jgi:hypothetical protein
MEQVFSTYGLKDPQNAEMANKLLEFKQAAMDQYANARSNAAAQAANAKQMAEDDLKKQFEAIPNESKIIPDEKRLYPAIEHDFNAAAKRIQFNHQLSLINPTDAGADTRIKLLNERMPAKERQDFVDTDLFKSAEQENTSNKERVTMANNLYDQLLKMKSALDSGDNALAANIGKTGIMKSINSLQGKDAVSPSEQATRYQELLSLPDLLIQNTTGQSTLNTLIQRMAMTYQKDNKSYNNAADQLNALAKGAIEADPSRFYRIAYELHNAAADTASRNVERVVKRTSPYHAKLMQANMPQRLPEQAAPTAQPASSTSIPYGQTAPLGTPVSGGGSSAVSAGTTQAPQVPSQNAPRGVDPALLERMKELGIAPPR